MADPNWWATEIAAEWVAVSGAPFIFLGALAALVTCGWLFWRFWYKHEISNLQSDVQTANKRRDYWKERFDDEAAQHAASKNTLASYKPQLELMAKEVAAIPQLKAMVQALARGEKFETPYDPSKAPELWGFALPKLEPPDIRKAALLANTSVSGVSGTISMGITYVTIGTERAKDIAFYLEKIGKNDDNKK